VSALLNGDSEPVSSFWIESTPTTHYPELEGDIDVDVAVVGAGITGVTSAYLLKQAGKRVALLDLKRVARGATGYTTAKITSGHNLIYASLEKSFGTEGARTYAQANEAGVAKIREIVEDLGLDCDLETKANYAYAEKPDSLAEVESEVAVAKRAGLAATFVRETPLPFPVAGAIRLDDQAQFHPRKYLLPLVERIDGDGSHVFENTRVRDVRHGAPAVVEADGGSVRAAKVLLATHLPFEDQGLFFAKAYPQSSYAVAAPIDVGAAPDGMFISVDSPTRSLRTALDGEGLLLIVGGEGHKTGQEPDTRERYGRLQEWARARFGLEEFRYRWATHDHVSVDKAPFVGRLVPWNSDVWLATAYSKWGMTNGTAAAILITDVFTGRKNPWADFFSPHRGRSFISRSLISENANVAKRFVGDRIGLPGKERLDALAPGDGALVRIDGEALAVSRAEDGALRAVSPRCAHLGCYVAWNAAEQTWDCPCHGSRYLADGGLIEGPAVDDLAARELFITADS
jgi:glycine/D-amino acid oxidase-like deaminating enzyme/nitrite reductase/ring-hydroxylating ferredoxin subunit